MSTMEEPTKHWPPKIVKMDNALKLAEQWVNNMTRAAEDEQTEIEGRPSRLGLGARVPHQSKLGPLNHHLGRKLYAKLDAQTRTADEYTLAARDGCGDDGEDLESRTTVFGKKRAAKAVTTSLHSKKKQK
ncbi:hypothetical protein TIFTF001_013024 [Ficus carica]|uniref:Uncharacterized protein n=1 Tax=Ficus carica TaxID=3494 RepID=A0AA88D476_FICCA|nr:hypothetical protein TIFTF001_013024 [Ficus carica]